MSGDETAEVRVLDLADFPGADNIADDAATAQVLVDLPEENAAESRASIPLTPEKTINIQHGGGVARIRVKLSTTGGWWGGATWSVVRHDGKIAIRVTLEPGVEPFPSLPLPAESQPGATSEVTPNCTLWVVLERNQPRDSP